MPVNNEKLEALAAYLSENEVKGEELLSLPAAEACAKINAEGYDFTAEDLVAFAEIAEKIAAQQEGELDESDLDNVAGGAILQIKWKLPWWIIKPPIPTPRPRFPLIWKLR